MNIDLDLQGWKYEQPSLCRDVLISVASTELTLRDLSLSHTCISKLVERYDERKFDLLRCTSALKAFRLWRGNREASPSVWDLTDLCFTVVEDIFESAIGLERLCLQSSLADQQNQTVVTRNLITTSTLALKELHLSTKVVSEEALLAFLSQCEQALTLLPISGVHLTLDESVWIGIFYAITMMPRLRTLRLATLGEWTIQSPRVRFISFEHIEVGEKCRTTSMYN